MQNSILSPVGVLEALKQITEKYKEDFGIKEAPTEIELPRQKEVAPESDPQVIELVFSEVDRQSAKHYLDNNACLICSALRNRGYNAKAYSDCVDIEGERYEYQNPKDGLCNGVAWDPFTMEYGPEVVGKKVILTKV